MPVIIVYDVHLLCVPVCGPSILPPNHRTHFTVRGIAPSRVWVRACHMDHGPSISISSPTSRFQNSFKRCTRVCVAFGFNTRPIHFESRERVLFGALPKGNIERNGRDPVTHLIGCGSARAIWHGFHVARPIH